MEEKNSRAKFEILCQTFAKAQAEYREYRDSITEFTETLWQKFITYYQVPWDQASLYLVNEEGNFQMVIPQVENALTLRTDGWWEIGFGITLYETPDTFPQETLVFHILVKRDLQKKYHTCLCSEEEEFIIRPDEPADFEGFLDYIFQNTLKSYQTGLQTFLEQKTVRKIGFKREE